MRVLFAFISLFFMEYACAAGAAPGSSAVLEEPVKLLAYMAAGIGIFLVGIKCISSDLIVNGSMSFFRSLSAFL